MDERSRKLAKSEKKDKKIKKFYQIEDNNDPHRTVQYFVWAYTAKQAEAFYAKVIKNNSALRFKVVAKQVDFYLCSSHACPVCGYVDVHAHFDFCPSCN